MARQVVIKELPEDINKKIESQQNLQKGINLRASAPSLSSDEVQYGLQKLRQENQNIFDIAGNKTREVLARNGVDIFTAVKNTPKESNVIKRELPGDTAVKNVAFDLIKSDPKAAAEKAAQAEADEAAGKPVGDVDKFLSALTYFLPTALSGVLGAAIGGSEAGVAAAGATQSLQKGYIDHLNTQSDNELKAIELNQKQNVSPKMDLTPNFLDLRTGLPATVIEKKDGGFQYIDAENNIIPQKYIQSADLYKANKFEESQNKRQDRIDQRQERQQRFQDNEVLERRLHADIDSFSKDKLVAKDADSLSSMDDFESMLNSDLVLSSDFVATFIAKGLQGNVGAMAEGDIIRAKVPMNIGKSAITKFKQGLTGDMSKDERQSLAKIVRVMKDKKRDNLLQRAKNRAADAAGRLGISAEGLEKSYLSRLINIEETQEKTGSSRLRR